MKRSPENDAAAADAFVEDVEISGHIIDSLILPKVLDCISADGGTFRIKTISIGQACNDASYGLVEVRAESSEQLADILGTIADHGAIPTVKQDCHLIAADMNGAFPEGFYSTTNQRTEIRMRGEWMDVAAQEMDCGVVVDKTVVTNAGCDKLHRDLADRGFTPIAAPLDEFVKAGGSAKCLTLRLDGEDSAAWETND